MNQDIVNALYDKLSRELRVHPYLRLDPEEGPVRYNQARRLIVLPAPHTAARLAEGFALACLAAAKDRGRGNVASEDIDASLPYSYLDLFRRVAKAAGPLILEA